jgi:hypothetical protein
VKSESPLNLSETFNSGSIAWKRGSMRSASMSGLVF